MRLRAATAERRHGARAAALPALGVCLWAGAISVAAAHPLPQSAAADDDAAGRGPAPAATSRAEAAPAQAIAAAQAALQRNPDDADALEALARARAGLGEFPGAIAAYQRVVAAHPDDRGAEVQLGRLLSWNRQYADAIRTFQNVLAQSAGNREALEGLADAQRLSGDLSGAAASYATLAARYPSGAGYLFEAARLEQQLHHYAAARDRLATLLALQPGNTDARLVLAQLELHQGQYSSALRQFERVLAVRRDDVSARMGAAQALYYTGDLKTAYADASQIVYVEPRNFDALFLLASIERARGHRAEAGALLRRADKVARHNREAAELRAKLREESPNVLHLSAGYTREYESPAGAWVPQREAAEDLRTLDFGSRFDFAWLPRSTSSFSFDFLPTESLTGVPASAGTSEFLYRQTTRIASRLTVRFGFGLQSFGRVRPVNIQTGPVVIPDFQLAAGPQSSARPTPVGFAGASFSPFNRVSFDFTWSRSAAAYTPLAAWLGVISDRREGGVNLDLDRRTTLRLTYFQDSLFSQPYWHGTATTDPGAFSPPTYLANDREQGSGGTVVFNRRVIGGERVAFDAGFSALALGYNGARDRIDLGFFTPSFYQRDLITATLSGRLSSRLGYTLATGVGVQQVDQGQPFHHAFTVSPTLNLKLTPCLSTSLGYTYYDSSQLLGIVAGNGVRLGIDWRF